MRPLLLTPPLGYKVVLNHVHDPQLLALLPRNPGEPVPRYVTTAFVVKDTFRDGFYGVTLTDAFGVGQARCHPRDNPSRKIGRAIAHNRAVNDFFNRYPPAGFVRALNLGKEL